MIKFPIPFDLRPRPKLPALDVASEETFNRWMALPPSDLRTLQEFAAEPTGEPMVATTSDSIAIGYNAVSTPPPYNYFDTLDPAQLGKPTPAKVIAILGAAILFTHMNRRR